MFCALAVRGGIYLESGTRNETSSRLGRSDTNIATAALINSVKVPESYRAAMANDNCRSRSRISWHLLNFINYRILPATFGQMREVLMAKQGQKLLRVGAAAHELGLHPMTVRRWIKAGRIQVVHVGREMRIPRAEIERMVGSVDGRLLVLYGRVSGQGQKDDLDMQIQRLQVWATTERKGMETLILSDIGSGLKASRRQFQRLLKLVCGDRVAEVAITYEDRLTRFGQEYLDTLFACFGVTLTVLEPKGLKQRHHSRS